MYFMEARQNFAKTKSRSPRGFLPRPLLRAGESIIPPPLPQIYCGGVQIQISSSGLLSKKVRILYNEYRNFSKRVSECKMGSARSADTNEFPPPNSESKRVFHAPRGSSFANTKL